MLYLIWSIEHTAWWRPASCGYTQSLHEAGHYPKPEAERILARANIVAVEECLIPASMIGAAPELLDALAKLANEAEGFLARANIQPHGHTNRAVLSGRIDAARAAIAKTTEGR